MVRRLIHVISALVVALALAPAPAAQPESRLAFIGVALDAPTRQADRRLTDYLYEKVGIRFTPEELEYGQIIRRLVDWRREDGLFLARVTPYAFVVAELLGAAVEPVATYVSRTTDRSTYRSYLVVNAADFGPSPDLNDVIRFIRAKPRARFIYQSEYSTSSFFLPSLFFRTNGIFQMPESTERLTAIGAERLAEASSAELVERVARGEADLAAVWDGVKARFENDPASAATGRRVRFVPLPTPIPNDLLVCASGIDAEIKTRLRQAVANMRPDEIGVGDFRSWRNLTETADARQALGNLRQTALVQLARVPVEIVASASTGARAGTLIEAARQAVRLSETEFVVYDADFHGRPDVKWTIESIHDGAVVLRSAMPGYDVDEQTFTLSFRDDQDLTARIVAIIQSRLHRIRYVWPYGGTAPIILRDSAFALPVGAPVKVQRITWIDPDRNQFRAGEVFESRIARASFHRYELEAFSGPAAGDRPDPLSNAAFRVILVRPLERPWFLRVLTMALVGCFVLAGAFAAWDLVRRPRQASTPAPPRPPSA